MLDPDIPQPAVVLRASTDASPAVLRPAAVLPPAAALASQDSRTGHSGVTKSRSQRKRRILTGLLVLCAVALSAAVLWRFTPLAEWLQPQRLAQQLETIERFEWSPFAFVGAYVLGGLVMFPVTVLGAASAIVFPPLKAIAVSFSGVMISAALLHWMGRRFIRGRLKNALGPTIKRVDEALSDRGIVTIATLRMIPLAPFTLVNIAAGVTGLRFRDYMVGTALGLAPGITVVCFFGRQVRAFWKDPNLDAVLPIAAIGLVWIGMSILLQRWVSRRSHHRGK